MMQKESNEILIDSSFGHRYFKQNAEQRYAMQLLEFFLWKRGEFVLPKFKEKTQAQFMAEEINIFCEKKIINIPQLQFLITTRCSLRCKNCNAYIPFFGGNAAPHKDLTPEDFRLDLRSLEGVVHTIRRFILIGGEPLLHPRLAELIEIAISSPLVQVVEIITNGTLVPKADVLEISEQFKESVYFHISNYSNNIELLPRLKHKELFAALKRRDIKYQMAPQISWSREVPLQGCLPIQAAKDMFSTCWLKRCLQVIDGKIAICPKASCGFALGMASSSPEGEIVDLRSEKDLRQALIAFYQRDFFEVCRSCVRIDETVEPAEQL